LNVISLILCGKQFNFLRSVAVLRKYSGEGANGEKSAREFSLDTGSILFNTIDVAHSFSESGLLEKETMKRLISKDLNKKIISIIESQNKELMIKLALTTLSNFDFRDFSEPLTHFFDEIVLNYLDNENDEIREAAVKTCSNLTISRDG